MKENHGTALLHVDGAYVELQKAVINALPRDISPDVADYWRNNNESLARVLRESLSLPKAENFLRETGELSIEIPALPRPTLEELQAKHSWIKKIERDVSPTGPVTLTLATVFDVNANGINGKEYERRLSGNLSRLLGYQQREWLMEHQKEHPAFMALLGKIYIDFPGIVVVAGLGSRCVPSGHQSGGRWDAHLSWLSNGFDRAGRVAVSGR